MSEPRREDTRCRFCGHRWSGVEVPWRTAPREGSQMPPLWAGRSNHRDGLQSAMGAGTVTFDERRSL